MNIVERIKKLPDDWKRIVNVAKKPDKGTFNMYLKTTIIVMAFIGLLAYLIQLVLAFII
ncbi:preprotein translocase subunit SecE [Acidianus sp. HS-5]|uniref:SecE/sec61-gamma family protein translocase subunit n=1 Tax=Acidianus sp. HS-5 TaxID=2886040 RepID=UPI001F1FD020|nr:preprotein translocase subunit SecE [Acidianus sp. HS-5]BDC19804.1 preprotein translocase subunit SecE [Acidianus sp. HS-5]